MDNKKINYFDYQAARNFEQASDLCWNLCGFLQDSFVGYENEVSILRSMAIEFEKSFADMISKPYEG